MNLTSGCVHCQVCSAERQGMRTLFNSDWDKRSALLDWESDHSPYHEGFKQIRVVSTQTANANLSSELQTLQPSRNSSDLIKTVQISKLQNSLAVSGSRCMPPTQRPFRALRPSRSRIPPPLRDSACFEKTLAEMLCCRRQRCALSFELNSQPIIVNSFIVRFSSRGLVSASLTIVSPGSFFKRRSPSCTRCCTHR